MGVLIRLGGLGPTYDPRVMNRPRFLAALSTRVSASASSPAPAPAPAPAVALALAWLVTRAMMLWLLAHDSLPVLGGRVAREVWRGYHHWYGTLSTGAFPAQDTLWQYPPGAGLVLLAPGALPWWTYLQAFVALTVAADAVVAVALVRAGARPGRSLYGAALWVGGLPLLLRLPLARYDVLVTSLAVISLLTLKRSTRACGAFAALGALVKVW